MRTIEITTTQNVTIEYELATLQERVIAFIIDSLLVGAMSMVIISVVSSILRDALLDSFNAEAVLYQFLPIGLLIFYHLLSEIIADGQSWGKKAMGIKVVRLDGQEPGLIDYLLRAVFLIVDALLSAGIVAALLISSSNNSQRLGDMTANTTVIRVKFGFRFRLEDILKINSLEDYEPQYPEVRRLSEQDMLLIKNIITRYRKYKNPAHREVINDLVVNLTKKLDLIEPPKNKIEFLKTLIRDYIVLTR